MSVPVRHRSHATTGPHLDNDLVTQASPRVPASYSYPTSAATRAKGSAPSEDERPAYPRSVLVFALGIISLAFPLVCFASLVMGFIGMRSTRPAGKYRRDTLLVLGYTFSIVSTVSTVLMTIALLGGGFLAVVLGWINYFIQTAG